MSVSRSGRARITYRLDGRDAATARGALVNMARLARAAGAERVVAVGTPGQWFEGGPETDFDAYLARIARSSTWAPTARWSSVPTRWALPARASNRGRAQLTRYGRVRRDARGALVKGLYVGDASLFPRPWA